MLITTILLVEYQVHCTWYLILGKYSEYQEVPENSLHYEILYDFFVLVAWFFLFCRVIWIHIFNVYRNILFFNLELEF